MPIATESKPIASAFLGCKFDDAPASPTVPPSIASEYAPFTAELTKVLSIISLFASTSTAPPNAIEFVAVLAVSPPNTANEPAAFATLLTVPSSSSPPRPIAIEFIPAASEPKPTASAFVASAFVSPPNAANEFSAFATESSPIAVE